ncbi:MAG: sulfurtransferase TusA family protein [Proteobacteria bacterium]|nr:sulfurtransferase TusA family protein [Pseudomonadota bacterium]
MSDITPNETLDCSGLSCPQPILKTKKAIKGMSSGQILKMTSTDPGTNKDMETFCAKTGHELVEKEERDGATDFFVKVK